MILARKERKSASIKKNASLSLRPLKASDGINVCRWMTSSYILQHSFVVPSPKSVPDDFASIEYASRYFDLLMTDPSRLSFAIVVQGEHIGNIGLKEISADTVVAECFIEIGEHKWRAQGFGIEAMRQLLEFAFYDIGLSRVELDVLEFNFAALKIYHRLGFITTGFSGWHYDEFGQYWRVLKMCLHQSDW